ncbi:MAG: methyltransferase [Deltaproteobacteria bacterium]|nr:methyltransferase [Deltaproteobacteria bacterium]
MKKDRIGPFVFVDEGSSQKITTDTLLLSEFVLPIKSTDTVIELGAASGALLLSLCAKGLPKMAVGVEIDKAAASAAQKNVERNNLEDTIDIINSDWRDLKGVLKKGSFSVVVCNPPYVKAGEGRLSPDAKRRAARAETHGTLRDLITALKYLLAPNGRACFIFPVKRLVEMLGELEAASLYPGRMRFIYFKKTGSARLFLIECSNTGGALVVEEPLYAAT